MIRLNLGRNCLRYLIRAYGIKKIFLPYYSCRTVWIAARAEGCEVRFYHIGKDFMPAETFGKKDYVLYINYYGLCDTNCEELEKIYPNLIVDNTQAFYSPKRGLASFNSLRKFFKVQNGAYLYTDRVLNECYETDKFLYIPKTMQEDYEQFVQNELLLNDEPIKYIYPEVEKEMNRIDFEADKKNRREKFLYYQEKYGADNLIRLELKRDSVPYCYPLSTKNETVKKELNNDGISYLTLWGRESEDFLSNVVALPLV
ncbi:MAG: hypothetical protein K6E29_09005 [Cyanobacteria bacterium RUI128]|nr:hypothetical protein [Cyanobacteria bacterium RUI128]